MHHSVTYGEKNTWDDWHLIPTSRPLFNPPGVKTSYLDIPGANGIIDLTESLTGYPVYENRTGSQEYIVSNGYKPWDVIYSEIMNYLHGQRMKAVLEDDKAFYYEGRFSVNQWKSDKNWSLITIDYDVYPYKKELNSSVEDWLWDPFDFETGIINDFKLVEVETSVTVTVIGRQEYISPTITIDSDDGSGMDVVFESETYHMNDGINLNPNIIIKPGENNFTFTGSGTFSIDYRGGSL